MYSPVNVCRFTCSFLLRSSISLVLTLCVNRQTASPTLKKRTAQFPVFHLEQLISSVKPLNISVNLVFRDLTVFYQDNSVNLKMSNPQSHSQAFVIASKIFNAPSGYSDNRKAIKSYSLKMSFLKLFCGLGQLVWFGYCLQHCNALLHQLLSHSAISTQCTLWAPQEFNTLNKQIEFLVALWISKLSNGVPECALVLLSAN